MSFGRWTLCSSLCLLFLPSRLFLSLFRFLQFRARELLFSILDCIALRFRRRFDAVRSFRSFRSFRSCWRRGCSIHFAAEMVEELVVEYSRCRQLILNDSNWAVKIVVKWGYKALNSCKRHILQTQLQILTSYTVSSFRKQNKNKIIIADDSTTLMTYVH